MNHPTSDSGTPGSSDQVSRAVVAAERSLSRIYFEGVPALQDLYLAGEAAQADAGRLGTAMRAEAERWQTAAEAGDQAALGDAQRRFTRAALGIQRIEIAFSDLVSVLCGGAMHDGGYEFAEFGPESTGDRFITARHNHDLEISASDACPLCLAQQDDVDMFENELRESQGLPPLPRDSLVLADDDFSINGPRAVD